MQPFLHVLSLSAVLGSIPSVASTGTAPAPHGRYVEARTASVFAGACHYGGERTTQGREALLAFHFDGGAYEGVELAGGDVAVLIRGDANLADPLTVRRSVIYLSNGDSPAQRDALVASVKEHCAAVLGAVESVRAVDLDVRLGADTYDVRAQDLFELRGATLPDRACCKMPYNVWYEPFVALDAAIVGLNTAFACGDKSLGATWSRPDENASFLGDFDLGRTRTVAQITSPRW